MGEFQQDMGTATGYLKRTLVMAPIMEHLSLCLKTLNDREQVKGRLQLQGKETGTTRHPLKLHPVDRGVGQGSATWALSSETLGHKLI